METLAKRLAHAMKAANMTQNSLARAASSRQGVVSQQVVQHLLSGRNQTSKHLPALAAALGVGLEWLAAGKGQKGPLAAAEGKLIGKVGAGAEVHRLDQVDVLAGIPLTLADAPNVLEISGDSQYPLREGWRVFYGKEDDGIPKECIGALCVAQVRNGPILLKTVKKGSKSGLYRLESWNADPREDVPLDWAAKVRGICPV